MMDPVFAMDDTLSVPINTPNSAVFQSFPRCCVRWFSSGAPRKTSGAPSFTFRWSEGGYCDQAEGDDHDPGSASAGLSSVSYFQRNWHRLQDWCVPYRVGSRSKGQEHRESPRATVIDPFASYLRAESPRPHRQSITREPGIEVMPAVTPPSRTFFVTCDLL